MNASDVWILIPVHNRREITRSCLNRLREQGIFERATVCVVDDACSDGTRAMLEEDFPAVRIVPGNGHLFWGGGILTGMQEAHARGAVVMIWLNDDCQPEPGAIEVLVRRVLETRGICGGICHEAADRRVQTYSGTRLGGDEMVSPAAGQTEPVDLINGNLVAVHREVVERIGFIPGLDFPHYGGDSVYALRAVRAGIPCEVHGDALAVNPTNPYFARFGTTRPATDLLKEPFRIGSIFYWPTYWRFLREAFGWKAYLRWPFFFVRLIKQFAAALARQRAKGVPL